MGKLIFLAPSGKGIPVNDFKMPTINRQPDAGDVSSQTRRPRWCGDEMIEAQRAPEAQKREDPFAGEILK